MISDADQHLADLRELVDLPLPPGIERWLRAGVPRHAFGLPLLGLPIDDSLDDCWGATLVLQAERPDLPRKYLTVRLMERRALCLDLAQATFEGTPFVEVRLEGGEPPMPRGTFENYLRRSRLDVTRSERILARVQTVLNGRREKYDHIQGGKLPRAHEWRAVRSCVHDRVVGIAALRQDDQRNLTQIDVFEASDHPLYESGHGIRSLTSLVLADAYKTGVSMALNFLPLEGLRDRGVSPALLRLAADLQVHIASPGSGTVSHEEGVALFALLSGLSATTIARVASKTVHEAITLETLSSLIIGRCWTAEEVEWILAAAPRPAAVLFGDDTPEDWLGQTESASYAHAAILCTMLAASLNEEGEEGADASVSSFAGGFFSIEVRNDAELRWAQGPRLLAGAVVAIMARPRHPVPFEASLILADASSLAASTPGGARRLLLYSQDVRDADFAPVASDLNALGVEIVRAPYRIADLDQMLDARLAKARRVRR